MSSGTFQGEGDRASPASADPGRFSKEKRALYVYALLPSHPLIVVAHRSTGRFPLPHFPAQSFLLPARWSGAGASPPWPVAWHTNDDDHLSFSLFLVSRFRDRTVTDIFVTLPLEAGCLHLDSIFPFLSLPPFFSSPVSRSANPITLSFNFPR